MSLDLTVSREFEASPSTVWRCLVEPELLARWFEPDPVKVVTIALDPVPGGIFHLVMEVPEMGEMDGGAGCVLLAEPERRMAWTSALGPG